MARKEGGGGGGVILRHNTRDYRARENDRSDGFVVRISFFFSCMIRGNMQIAGFVYSKGRRD